MSQGWKSLKNEYIWSPIASNKNRISRNAVHVRSIQGLSDFFKPGRHYITISIKTSNNISMCFLESVFPCGNWSRLVREIFEKSDLRVFFCDIGGIVHTIMGDKDYFRSLLWLIQDGFNTFLNMGFFIMSDDENGGFHRVFYWWWYPLPFVICSDRYICSRSTRSARECGITKSEILMVSWGVSWNISRSIP